VREPRANPDGGRKHGPQTPTGFMLAALARRDQDEFVRWRAVLNTDRAAAAEIRPILYEAFREVVERRFSDVIDRREILRFLQFPRTPLWPEAQLPLLETEALIRSALGERGLVGGIPGALVASIRIQIFVHVIDDLGLAWHAVEDLICLAERYAEEDRKFKK
jgi:hypothetical protein